MANNSAKKNEQNIRTIATVLTWAVYGLIGWVMLFNSFFLVSEQVSIWHWLLCVLVSGVSYFAYKQVMKCWELQLPEGAADYYYDILALNSIVQLLDPYTHSVWHLYWLIVVYLAWQGVKWGWGKLNITYKEDEEEEGEERKKEKKEKKERVKYARH